MRVVLQRVKEASVTVENEMINEIKMGYLLLVAITDSDDEVITEKMAKKIHDLRIFEDENGKMNLSIDQVGGSILSISQFTLFADCKKGRRPSFDQASRPEKANLLIEQFNKQLQQTGLVVKPGIFKADMKILLWNDGPVTLILDSESLF